MWYVGQLYISASCCKTFCSEGTFSTLTSLPLHFCVAKDARAYCRVPIAGQGANYLLHFHFMISMNEMWGKNSYDEDHKSHG